MPNLLLILVWFSTVSVEKLVQKELLRALRLEFRKGRKKRTVISFFPQVICIIPLILGHALLLYLAICVINYLVFSSYRSSPQGRNNQASGPVKSVAEEELVTKEKFERTKSKLEAELTDIQDRYFHMSLKYAEVEAKREELVMQLKMAKSKKGWLS
jgi:hypothetical protein